MSCSFFKKTGIADRSKTGKHGLYFLAVFLFFVLSLTPSTSKAMDVTLAWDPSTTPNVIGYYVYVGTASGDYDTKIDVGNQTSCTLSGFAEGTTYYFAAAAYNSSGVESALSKEMVFTTPQCTFTLSPSSATYDARGGNGTVNITSLNDCYWTTLVGAPWIVINSGSSGIGNGQVQYTVLPNSENTSRVGTIMVASKVFTVTQSAGQGYVIVATAGSGGSINPSGAVSVANGASQTFTITPSANSRISDVKVDGVSAGAVTSYTFSSVKANHTIAASFISSNQVITVISGTGGSISPAGPVSVARGSSQIFTITPSAGYTINNVKIDGVSIGAVTSYTFPNITADHTIEASFGLLPAKITVTAGAGGSVSPAGTVTVAAGSSQTFTVTPSAGYTVQDVKVDGTSVGPVNTYTFSNLSGNHIFEAVFAVKNYVITVVSSSGGTVSPSGPVTLGSGSNQTFAITPSVGFAIKDVKVDGTSVGAVTTYTFSNVTGNHTIDVTFAAKNYVITVSASSGGSVSPAGPVNLASGSSQTFTISPSSGYTVSDVKIDGTSVGQVTSYTFSNVTADHSIQVQFQPAVTPSMPMIPQSQLKLVSADSQETTGENGAAVNAIDGRNDTIWHTQWYGGSTPYPHEIMLDLGSRYTVGGFRYLPRQDGGVNGTVANYEFYVSEDGINWGTAVASGTFAGNTTEKKVTTQQKTGRYVRFRALSEINGRSWTSMAELNVMGNPANNTMLSQSQLKLVYVDSTETTPEERALNAIDGLNTTIWHTRWSGTNPPNYPHEVVLQLDKTYLVTGFRYVPRQDGIDYGTVANYALYVSTDGVNWGNPVATGTFAKDTSPKTVNFPGKVGSYLRFVALSEINGRIWASAAELNVIVSPVNYTTLSQSQLKLAYVDSTETSPEERALNAIDGLNTTIWHTRWSGTNPPNYPHEMVLQLDKTYTVAGFRYVPRQDGLDYGTVANYALYVSTDGGNWGNPVATGTFAKDTSPKTVYFTGKTGSYFRFVALSEINGRIWTSAAELNVIVFN